MPSAAFDISATGTILSGVSGKQVRVHALIFQAAGSVAVTVKDTADTAKTGALQQAAGTSFSLQHNPDGWFTTAVGEGVKLTLSGSVQVGGIIEYSLFPLV